MVATRSGVRVGSPNKSNTDESTGVLATSSSTRRTRNTAAQFEETTDFQQDVSLQALCSTGKRKTRTSKRQTGPANQPDSTHEADVSDLDSCYSAVSDTEAVPSTQPADSNRKRGVGREHPDSKEGSSFSPVSATQEPSSTRRRKNDVSDSCRSELSATKVTDCPTRLTRSTRRTAVASNRASSQSHTDAELSDPELCASGVQSSTIRRSRRARNGRLVEAIPMHLEEIADCSKSPVPRRGKVSPSDHKASDSEGFESGPCMTPRRSARRWAEPKQPVTDSESELSEVYAPLGRPSRTRSNSSSQAAPPNRMTVKALDTPAEKASYQSSTVSRVAETSLDSNSNNLETIINADQDYSAIEEVCEEDRTLTLDGEDVLIAEPEPSQDATLSLDQMGSPTAAEDAEMPEASVQCGSAETTAGKEVEKITSDVPTQAIVPQVKGSLEVNVTLYECAEEAEITRDVSGTAGEAEDQQMVPSAKEAADASVFSSLVLTSLSDSHGLLNQPGTVTVCEHAISPLEKVLKEETTMDVDVNSNTDHPSEIESQEDEAVSSKMAMDVSCTPVKEIEKIDQDKAPHTIESISVTFSQNVKVHASNSEELRDSIIVQKNSCIVQIESSVDEEDDIYDNFEEEGGKKERKVLYGEQKAVCEEDEAGPSRPQAATASQPVAADDGLFFIDTQPGIRSGEHCYMNKHGDMEVFEDKSEDEEDESCNNSEEERGKRERKGLYGELEAVCEEDEARPSRPRAATAAQPVAAADGLFFSKDTQPGLPSGEPYYMDKCGDMEAFEDKNEEDFFDEEGSDNDEDAELIFTSRNPQLKELSSCIDPGLRVKELGGLYINFDGSKSKTVSNSLRKLKEQKSQDELMKKSVIVPEFEKKDSVPPYKESKHAAKLKHKEEKEKTAGSGWFDMKAPEMTEELKADLKALKMRGAMDPKRFYKKSDRDGLPKYFQLATVVDNPVDFYHSRVPKKQRKRTIVEELLADAEFRHNNKKQYKKIMAEKAAIGAGKQKKRSKFKT